MSKVTKTEHNGAKMEKAIGDYVPFAKYHFKKLRR